MGEYDVVMSDETNNDVPQFPRALSLIGNSHEASVNAALEWITGQTKEGQSILVVRPVKNSNVLNSYPQLKRFLQYRNVIDATPRTAPYYFDGPVLLLWPTREMLGQFSNCWTVTALCVAEWETEVSHPWAAAFDPEILNGTLEIEWPELDPVAKTAIEEMGTSSNLNNRFISQDDKDVAVNGIKSLLAHGHELDSDIVYAHAMSLGWPGDAVDEFMNILKRLQSGVQVRTHSTFDHYDYWVNRTNE